MWPFSQQQRPDGRDTGTLPPGPPAPRDGGIVGWLRSFWGGWPGPQFGRDTEAERDLTREHVRAGPAGIILPWFLPYRDDVTGETHEHRLAYRQMWRDANVKAATAGKLFGVASLDLRINPASKSYRDGEVADFVQWALTKRCQGGYPEMAWGILSGGLTDGYSLSEKVWALEEKTDYGNKVVLDKLRPLDTGNDVIPQTDDHLNIDSIKGLRYNAGMTWDPRNFVLYRHMPMYGRPTGISDFRAAYRPWWLIDTCEKLRGILIEKKAIPQLLGEYETGAQKPSLEAALARARSQNWLVVPKGVKVTVLDTAGSAPAIFDGTIKSWKHDVFLAIQGAILQSLEGTVSEGRGSSKVHKSTADLFKWYLSACLQWLLNQLIVDLVDLNYAVDKYPQAQLSAVDIAELSQDVNIDKTLNAMGVDLSKEDVYDRYGRKPPGDADDTIKGAPPKPAGPPADGPSPEEEALKRDMQPDQLDDTTPAAEVAGTRPFRFSEEWKRWLKLNEAWT